MIKVILSNEILKYITEIDRNRYNVSSLKISKNVANKLRKNSKKKSSYASNSWMKRLFAYTLLFSSVLFLSSCSHSGVSIDAEHFPDSAFREELSKYDTNENGVLSQSEMDKFDRLNLVGCRNFSGIEYLTNLKCLCIGGGVHLDCYDEPLCFDYDSTITELLIFDCEFLSGVSVKNSSSLEKLRIITCWGGELEVSQCTNLTYLDVQFGANTEYYTMKISGCDKLDRLYVRDNNNLSELSLSDCNLLSYALISSYSDSLSSFTVSGCPNINELFIMGSTIQEIDITGCPYLVSASKQDPNEDVGSLVNYISDDGMIVCDKQIKFAYS